jgi:hypothetical protein
MVSLRILTGLACFLCCFQLISQQRSPTFWDDGIYREKTLQIATNLEKPLTVTKINLFSLIDYRLIIDEKVQKNILDSSFYCKSVNNERTYISFRSLDTIKLLNKNSKLDDPFICYRTNDSILRSFCKKEIAMAVNNSLSTGVHFVKPESSDSLSLEKDFRRIKTLFQDSVMTEYSPSPRLAELFRKYQSDIAIVVDVLMYNNKHSVPKTTNTIAIFRLFVFDVKDNRLLYYKFLNTYDHLRYSEFMIASYDPTSKDFKKLLRSARSYIQENMIRAKN